MKIPTKLTAPITSEVRNKHRYKVFHTDVGEMSGLEIAAATGVPLWKILQRYYEFGMSHPGLLKPGKLVRKKEQPCKANFTQEEIDTCMKLSTKSRYRRLKKLAAIGTWEAQQCQTE